MNTVYFRSGKLGGGAQKREDGTWVTCYQMQMMLQETSKEVVAYTGIPPVCDPLMEKQKLGFPMLISDTTITTYRGIANLHGKFRLQVEFATGILARGGYMDWNLPC